MVHCFHFVSREPVPSENHRPRNSASQKCISADVIERILVDDVNDRRNNHLWILLNSLHQRLDPVFIHFNVAIQKGESVSGCDHGSANSSSDESLTFSVDDEFHFLDFDQFHSNIWITRNGNFMERISQSYVEASSTRTISLRIFAGVLRITEIIVRSKVDLNSL